MPLRVRLLPPAVLAAAILFLSVTGAAWALGELTQKPGAAGCIGGKAGDGCGVGRALSRPEGIAVSPDGRNVYVASSDSDAIAIFDRDPATGTLIQKPGAAGCISEAGGGCGIGRGIHGAVDIAVSPDGANVYVAAGGDSVAIFDRNPDGGLRQKPGGDGCTSQAGLGCRQGRGLVRPSAVAVSPDGISVYVASSFSNAVAIFDRSFTGELTQKPAVAGCVSDDGTDVENNACEDMRALSFARDVDVSPDGRSVYVAADGSDSNAVAIFERQAGGTLIQAPGQAACVSQGGIGGCQVGRGLERPLKLVVTPDGKSVLVAAQGSSAVVILDRDPQGQLSQKPGTNGCVGGLPRNGCQSALTLSPSTLAVSPDNTNVYAGSGPLGVSAFDRDAGGGLMQKPGLAACISQDGGEGCQRGRLLQFVNGLAVSPDGRSVYVTSFEDVEDADDPGSVAVFDRAVPPPPPADTVAPDVSRFKLVPSRFKRASKRGSSFRFDLSEAASVRIMLERVLPGRRVGKSCKAPRPKLAKRRACSRFARAGALDFAGRPQGANAIPFSGKVGKRSLRPGRYRATIVATDAAGNRSVPRRAGFTVLPSRAGTRGR